MSDPIESYKKHGKTYYRFKVYTGINPKTGKKSQTRRSGFKTKTAAKKSKLEIQQSVSDGSYWKEKDKSIPTFEECFNEWFSLKENELKGKTLLEKRNNFKKLADIHNIYIDQLTTKDIQRVINKSTTSVHLKNRRLQMTRSILEYALEQGYISKNPTNTIPKFKDHSVKEEKRKCLTESELKHILNDSMKKNIVYSVMIRLLAFSGLRIGEACALKWDDIKCNTVSVNKTVTRNSNGKLTISKPKTIQSIRNVIIDDDTLNILKLLDGEGYIFKGEKHPYMDPQNFSRFIKKNYDINPHMLRHTHASILFKTGVNPKVIQKRLGHSSFETTMNVYTHLFEDDETDNLDKYFNAIKG